jgi:hypothetical protein
LVLACSGNCVLYNQAIATLGKIVGASQVYVCRLSFNSEGNLKPLLEREWCEPNSCETPEKLSPPSPIKTQLFPGWVKMLEKDQIITGKVAELP